MSAFKFLCVKYSKISKLVTFLYLLCSVGALMSSIMWFTDVFDDFVMSNLVLRNNTRIFNMWQKPPINAIYKLYVFNYTNVKDYRKHRVNKLNVQEVGPYTYEETLERVEVSFPTEDTITYQETRQYKFRPDLSKGHQDDQLVIPNLVVLSGSAYNKPQNYFSRLATSALFLGIGEKPFTTLSAQSLISGYTDGFYSIATKFLPYQTPQLMGLLSTRAGKSLYNITINSGQKTMDKWAVVEKFNGQTEFKHFTKEVCNRIECTDGALHPPKLVQEKQTLHYLLPEACTRMPIIFSKEVSLFNGDIPAYQYIQAENIFDSVHENPENTCSCNLDDSNCSLKGLFNISDCTYGVPMFISHPHFRRGDPSLFKHFTGLHPENTTNSSYFNIHPTMGFLMSARTAFQLNVQVQKGVTQAGMFEDGMVLPIAYLEGIVEESRIPKEIVTLIYMATYLVPYSKIGLQYGSLCLFLISFGALFFIRKNKYPAEKIVSYKLVSINEGH